MRKIISALFAALISTSPANATCQVGKLLELPVTMQGARPMAEIGINGRSLPFIVDSGAFFSTISPGTAAELGLRLDPSPIQLRGVGGEAGRTYLARVKSLDLAGVPLHDIQFVVGGSETGAGGLLGQNILGIGDVEYDLEHGVIRVMRSHGCSAKDNLAYWANGPVSDLAIEYRDAFHPHTIGTVFVNGVRLRAIFDTGAGSSILSLDAAKRAGLTPSSPGVVPSGAARGLGRSMVQTWIAPIQTVKIGTEEVRNIKMHIGDIGEAADMLIGEDFFLSHRVYVANSLRHMYFTYDGGPVFSVTPSRVVDQRGVTETIAADSSPQPTDAAGFSRRGAAETSRHDYKAALADLDRAVAMDPGNGRYLLEHARTEFLVGNRLAALADLDRAVKAAPGDPEIRLARAETLVGRRKQKADALSDLQVADAALPRQADERLALAALFERLDQFDKALTNYDLWIAAHPDDSRQPIALNGRCWTRALSGRDLPLALKDCDAALRRDKAASYFDSRGLVELRMGQYDKAIADYSAALRLAPRTAWSLYGRGLARRHKNDPLSQGDLSAAVAIDPALPARAQALGIN